MSSRVFRVWFAAAATLAALALPAVALAHLERPSYWPDPATDTSVSPPAGGEVPTARTLRSAVTGRGPGRVRVVCKGRHGGRSLKALRRSLRKARRDGFSLRPSQPAKRVSRKKARRLRRINERFAERCRFKSIQEAVNRSHNNDRVVIMPGRYKEHGSRRAPVNDPRCADLTQVDSSGATTPSYAYQVTCPNDQNLIYVAGRELGGPAPEPPLANRQGLPDEGPCLRCNLQIEGSGLRPEDVILDGGIGYRGTGPLARPSDYAKHVVLRVDRADGFVGKNFLMRGALEHGFYTEETDGVLLNRTKFFWAADYGHLSFTTDHHEVRNCEGIGAGDAAVYPGAAPETGEQADTSFYPDAPRANTVIRRCDLHGNVLAYSGSMGNAVRITDNQIYGNTAGISSDSYSAAGHPGYPADGLEVDNNMIYSNNLNVYTPDPPVDPLVPMPIGSGIVWPGMNSGRVHDNWIFDNWRHGAVLLAVPDALVSPEGNINPGYACQGAPSEPTASTSCGNRYFNNKMGVAPPGFEPSPAVHDLGNVTGGEGTPIAGGSGRALPNGVDFWWDEFSGNTGNCWFANTGPDGTGASITGPGAGAPPDRPLPSNCEQSVGNGDVVKEAVLADCVLYEAGNQPEDHPLCYWFRMPPQPGSGAARREAREFDRAGDEYARSPEAAPLRERLEQIADGALADRP